MSRGSHNSMQNNFPSWFLRLVLVGSVWLAQLVHAATPLWYGAGSVTNNNFSNPSNWTNGTAPVGNNITNLAVNFGPLAVGATNTANCDATGNSKTWTFNSGTVPMIVTLNGQQLGAASSQDIFINSSTNLQTVNGTFSLFDIGGTTNTRRFSATSGPLAILPSQINIRNDSAPTNWAIELAGTKNGTWNTTFVNVNGTNMVVNYLKTGTGTWEVQSILPNLTLTNKTSSLTVAGGTLLLDAANTYTGPTIVSNGATLKLTTLPTGAGAYFVSNSATLGVTLANAGGVLTNASLILGTTGADTLKLTLDLASFGNPTNAPVTVLGALTVNGTCTVNLTNGVLVPGRFPLIKYGSQTGSGSFVLGTLPPGVTASLTNNVAGNSLDLIVTAAVGVNNIIYWNGNVSGLWDLTNTPNWKLNSQTNLTYADTNQVVFDDSASTNFNITLNSAVRPMSVTFDNSTNNYSLAGSGSIGGYTWMNLTGGGVVTISNANSFTGPTTVSTGALVLRNLGAVAGSSLNIADGAVVQPNLAGTYSNVTTTINGSSRANSSFGGSLDFHAGTTTTWPGQIILNDPSATIGCYGATCKVTLSGQLTGSGSLTIRPEGGSASSHTAIFTLSNPSNNYAGSTTMQVGTAELYATLKAGNNNALPVTTALTLDRAGSSGVVYFDLAGYSQTLAGLTADFGSNAVINTSNTLATLTVSNNADTVFNGVIGASTNKGITLIKQGAASLTLSGTNLYTGSTTIGDGTLAVNGLITATSGLQLSNNATLQLALGGAGGPTNIVVNGNVTLAGQINASDFGIVSNTRYPVIYYTGALTNNGISVASGGPCVFTIDTSTPHVVYLDVTQKFPPAEFTSVSSAVSTLTTNLSGVLHGMPTGPIWYEVRDQTNKLWDFGATRAVSPWSITVRHLRVGINTVTIFAQDGVGNIQSNSIQLTLTLGTNTSVRPRPIPSEIWWGGFVDNAQLTNYSQWPFVQKYEDGFFLRGVDWPVPDTAALQQSLATNLSGFNTKYTAVMPGMCYTPSTNWYQSETDSTGGIVGGLQSSGIILSEITHDYHMENMQTVCQVNPTWKTNDDIAWWTGDVSIATTNYPYTNPPSGIWRDTFNGYYQMFPHLKVGHISQPEYWPWGNFPSGEPSQNQLAFTITNSLGQNINMSFNASNIFSSFMNMAVAIGHPYYNMQSDTPWDYFYGGAGGSLATATTMRQMIRTYEKYFQSRGGRHTLTCNVSDASQQTTTNATDLYYETNSFNSMRLHQQEGGRANCYRFQSWYQGIPYVLVPETQAGNYTHLALSAIKYLKGIKDTNGALETLSFGVLSTGTTNQLSITNKGDVACLPAITASESGSGYIVAHYFNAAGQDVTSAMLNGEGYCHTNLLATNQSTTFTVVFSALPNTPSNATRSVTFEAFWNPQDPTGVVRDRKTISVTASNLVATPNPLAWYQLEGNGNDSSGNNFNATASNAVSFATGVVGTNAASFNGSSSYLQIPCSISNDFTISFWVKTTQTGGAGQWTAGKGLVDASVTGTTNDFGISLVGANAAFGVGNPDTTITSTAGINDGQWHHVAAIRANGSGAMNLYVDGVWQAGTNGPTGTRAAPPAMRLGSLQTAANYFSGTIDDVQLYGSALNGAQVGALALLGPANTEPMLAAIGDRSIIAGQTLNVTNSASDSDVPVQTLTFSLLSAPTNATINATNGIFTWRPTLAQAPSTNLISVSVTDNGTPPLSATQSFQVIVTTPVSPTFGGKPGLTGGGFSLQVNGGSGLNYYLQTATNLTPPVTWVTVQTNLSATPPFTFTDPAATNFNRRFYRVLIGP